jgi:hypothetical protein
MPRLFLAAAAVVAAGQASADNGAPMSHWWAGGGVGGSLAAASSGSPVSGRSGLAWNLELGRLFTRHWGIGVEVGDNIVESSPTCGYGEICVETAGDLARGKEIVHALIVGQYRVGGWRLQAGAGMFQYCHGTKLDGTCENVTAPGGAVSAAYFWRLSTRVNLGLRLGEELSHFPASSYLAPGSGSPIQIPAFGYAATTLTLQLSLN